VTPGGAIAIPWGPASEWDSSNVENDQYIFLLP
jgi:hypothetical protein